jgi:hypothetical protein
MTEKWIIVKCSFTLTLLDGLEEQKSLSIAEKNFSAPYGSK